VGLADEIRAVITDMQAAALDSVAEGATIYTDRVKVKAPHRTGAYQNSIALEYIDDHTVGCGSPQPYMMRLEYGFCGTDSRGRVYHQTAQAHWRPVLDAEQDRIRDVIAAAMRRRLRRGFR